VERKARLGCIARKQVIFPCGQLTLVSLIHVINHCLPVSAGLILPIVFDKTTFFSKAVAD
jgi:hypothetical protein